MDRVQGEAHRMVEGIVKRWDNDEGWGVLTSPDVPGDVFAHFRHIDAEGYRSLNDGERVRFDWEHHEPGQDGYLLSSHTRRATERLGDASGLIAENEQQPRLRKRSGMSHQARDAAVDETKQAPGRPFPPGKPPGGRGPRPATPRRRGPRHARADGGA